MSAFDFTSTQGYNQGFFECFKDPMSCVLSFFCAPCMVGKMKAELEEPKTKDFDVNACLCAGIAAYRNRRIIQHKYNIVESEDASMCGVGLLGCCAVSQDLHELRHQKFGSFGPSESQPAASEAPRK